MDKNSAEQLEQGGKVCDAGDSSYLQRELGHVLPVALAAVTQLQPSDPITVLALWLYKYRELNPRPQLASATDVTATQESSKSESPLPTTKAMVVNRPVPENVPRTRSLQIVEDYDNCGDFIEDSGHLGNPITKADVHCEIVPLFSDIGDLFDDDDFG